MRTHILTAKKQKKKKKKTQAPRGDVSIESGAHKKISGTIFLAAWVAVSIVLILPVASLGIFELGYMEFLKAIHEIVSGMLFFDSSDFVTFAFGVIGSAIALYALTASGRAAFGGAELIEYEVFGKYVSVINFLISSGFAALLLVELIGLFFDELSTGSAYIVASSIMGYLFCGILSGFYSQGTYLRKKSIQKNKEALRDIVRTIEDLSGRKSRKAWPIYLVQILTAFPICFTGGAAIFLVDVSWKGAVGSTLFGGIYFGLTACLVTMVRSTIRDRSKLSRRLQATNLTLCVVVAIVALGGQVLLTIRFYEMQTDIELAFALLVWILILGGLVYAPKCIGLYVRAVDGVRHREAVRRKELLEISIESQEMWLHRALLESE